MSESKLAEPSMKQIKVSQNEEQNLRRQIAKNYYYTLANGLHFVGMIIAILFALSSPLVLLYRPDLGPLLGAIAGAWIFLARLVFEPIRQNFQTKGAVAQEAFDCSVLGLPWNDSLARQLSEEEIRSASKSFNKAKVEKRHRDWYSANNDVAWPKSVIICQRSNAVWGRRQHMAYAYFLISLAVFWALLGIAISIIHQAKLSEYLTTIALPSLPVLLDATELAKGHYRAAKSRRAVEDNTNEMLDSGNSSSLDLREIQDQIFNLRKDAPSVANWFYKILARNYEEDMVFAASERAKRR